MTCWRVECSDYSGGYCDFYGYRQADKAYQARALPCPRCGRPVRALAKLSAKSRRPRETWLA